MKNILIKVLICIVSAAALIFAGLVGALVTAMTGGTLFYSPLILICAGVLIVFVILKVFVLIKPQLYKILFLSFLGICVLAVGGYEINKAWRNSFAKVNEQGVNLELYRPFAENTKAARLKEESTLKIADNLPRLDGATALYPLYAAFAQAVYPAGDYDIYAAKDDGIYSAKEDYIKNNKDQGEVACSNTINAYTRLMNGNADIIFTARPSEQQLAEAQSKGVELKLTPIGKEAFVFFVNSRNRVNGLTISQIQDIYSGKTTNWQEVGGKNEKIRAFQRPENSGSQTMLQKLMEGKNLMTPPREDIASGMGDIIEQTASYRNYKNAIGYSFLFFATEMVQNNEIKLLEVDGVKPDKNTIAGREYPLAAEFYAITVAGSDTPSINSFIKWILSPQGQYLIEKTGYTPINK